MAWQKYAAEAAAKVASEVLGGKKKNGGGGTAAIAIIAIAIALPVIVIVALFTGGNGGDVDIYETAFNKVGCDNEYYYVMEDIRFFDSYTRPDGDEPDDTDKLADRLKTDYLVVKESAKSDIPGEDWYKGKICLLKTDDDIYETLVSKYNVDEELKEEIYETIKQIRNGRQNFQMPASDADVIAIYGDVTGLEGVVLDSKSGTEVLAIADGEVVEIETKDSTYTSATKECEKEKGCSVSAVDKTEGLTVLIKHEVQKGINKQGDYDTKIMYSYFTNLKGVSLSVGDKVEQGKPIGTNNKDTIYFEIWNSNKKVVDPNEYMYIVSSTSLLPMEWPFEITSEMGPREPPYGEHYGLDMSKAENAKIMSIGNGKVVDAGNSCDGFGGPVWCPPKDGNIMAGGGNYAVIKTQVDGKTYYIQYDHMAKTLVKTGDKVVAGQTIGFQGNSGNSYGSHLHLEIHTDGINTASSADVVNPRDIIAFPAEEEQVVPEAPTME
ncbi:M23 family metallopeptidase [Breznakia pachnodae]|uniref:Murein DD-endopeptidase MepM/ murein hydrolase activator NlpD n=1 Tax=Breznakia pachnodae TaxID=265178 RepID=A0ABU0E6J8_9FIRM|nr:peptidoglycan DD-metalloendopeptidase family protein [Breznakia pachnodae]MDQ0362534.1 murein DD-endopeptidase MepM/ murein hydrolase activator NlpD [Breznakia pachnodae]